MSIPEQIRALESLAAVDAEVKILDDKLALERGTLATLTANLKKLEEKMNELRVTMGATEKLRNEYVGEVRSMTQQIDHSREKLGRSRNERESNAAQREIEELRKLVRDREEDVGKLTTDMEATRAQIEVTDGELGKLRQELGASEGAILDRLRGVEAEKSAKMAEREAAMKRLPPALFRKYDAIRSKRGVGIAQTTEGTCKACNMALPPQLFHRLRREPMLEQCPSCNRLIYFVPPKPAGAEPEPTA